MKPPSSTRLILTALSLCVLGGCTVTPVKTVQINAPRDIAPGTDAALIAFWKVVTKLPLGEPIGRIQYGFGCFPGDLIGYRGGRLNITDAELADAFQKELARNNYPVVGDSYALFDDGKASSAEILVGGLIDKVEINVCFPFSGSPSANIGNTSTLKGGIFMRVAWQMFSRDENRVVYETTTEGSFTTEQPITGSYALFLRNAFAANVRNLLADPGFHALVQKKTNPNQPPNQFLQRPG